MGRFRIFPFDKCGSYPALISVEFDNPPAHADWCGLHSRGHAGPLDQERSEMD